MYVLKTIHGLALFCYLDIGCAFAVACQATFSPFGCCTGLILCISKFLLIDWCSQIFLYKETLTRFLPGVFACFSFYYLSGKMSRIWESTEKNCLISFNLAPPCLTLPFLYHFFHLFRYTFENWWCMKMNYLIFLKWLIFQASVLIVHIFLFVIRLLDYYRSFRASSMQVSVFLFCSH